MERLFNEIKERVSFIEDLYDNIRVINPVNNKVLDIKSEKLNILEGECYDVWNRGKVCDNCISMQAYNEKETSIKIESHNNKVILIIANPIYIKGKLYILEILKDISNETIDDNYKVSIDNDLEKFNESIMKDKLTGFYNRKYINQRLPIDINNSIVEKYPLSLIVMEIENLNSIKEKFGTDIKNDIVKDICNKIKSINIEGQSWIALYDENEFFIELKYIEKNKAVKICEKIISILKSKLPTYNNLEIEVSFNFGVYCTIDEEIQCTNIIEEINKKLFKAKEKRKVDKLIEIHEFEKDNLSKITSKIEELRETLNNMCVNPNYDGDYESIVYVSQCLDELIVAYMKCAEKNNLKC